LILSASLVTAQTPNPNIQAVDTLTKEVAKAVFSRINQPKAQEILTQLQDCGDGCDAQQIIRGVGGWDAVGAKMEELSVLKNTAQFQAMAPADANQAIRRELEQFYVRYKSDRNYGSPLSPAVRSAILTKIDLLLPPAPATVETPIQENSASQTALAAQTDGETVIAPADLRISQLERAVKDEQEKQRWMSILSAVIGLLVGAGAAYLLLRNQSKSEINDLKRQNSQLSQENDQQRRATGNTARNASSDLPPQIKQNLATYNAMLTELGSDSDPVAAIRKLKQTNQTKPAPAPQAPSQQPLRSGGPVIEPVSEPVVPQPSQTQAVPSPEPIAPVTPPPAQPSVPRSEVFYCPPPDPNGQFDINQKSATLSPESAYRFSVSAEKPAVASFRFEAEPGRVARFLTYRNYMIEPACDSENSYSSSHTRIIMRRDGEAALENGVWRVKIKALIRYE
jgi:transposase-like protein